MKDYLSKNKILIGIIAVLAVAAVILVIVIVNNSSDDGKKNIENPAAVVANNGDGESIIADESDKSSDEVTPQVTESATTKPEILEGDQLPDGDEGGLSSDKEDVISDNSDEEKAELKIYNINVELGDYHNLKSDIVAEIITDEDVEERIQQNLASEMQVLDMEARPLKNGDMVVVSYTCTENGKKLDDLSVSNYQAILGENMLVKEMEDQIVGHQKGDSFEADLVFDSLRNVAPQYSDRLFHFNIEIVDSFEVYIPELTDEFIKKVSDYNTVAEYRKYLKNALQENANAKADSEKMKDLLEQIISTSSFSGQLEEKIDYLYDSEIKRMDKEYMEEYLVTADQYYQMYFDETPDEFHNRLRSEIEFDVKSQEVLSAIAEKENLTVSQEEYDRKFDEIFIKTYNFASADEVKSQVPQENIDYIVNLEVLQEKAQAIILNQ